MMSLSCLLYIDVSQSESHSSRSSPGHCVSVAAMLSPMVRFAPVGLGTRWAFGPTVSVGTWRQLKESYEQANMFTIQTSFCFCW